MATPHADVPTDLRAALLDGASAASIRAALCDALDARILDAFAEHVPVELAGRVLVLAVGGWGRREVYPHADADLLVLYRPADTAGDVANGDAADGDPSPAGRLDATHPGASAAMEAWFTGLRDAGVRLGARVRTVDEHARLIGEDVTVAAAALDARILAGDATICPDPAAFARDAIGARFMGGVTRFCGLIREGVSTRHERYGTSGYLLEPQLKTGRGGLRDAHAVRWASRLRFGTIDLTEIADRGLVTPTEAADFSAAFEFISRTRLTLHALTRYRTDRLAFGHQANVARLMGFGHGDEATMVAGFMKTFYAHAEVLANGSERWLQEWTLDPDDPDVIELGDGFSLNAGCLAYDHPVTGITDVSRVVRRAAMERLSLHPTTRSQLREVATALPATVCLADEAREVLTDALLSDEADPYALRALMDLGLLRVLVPEWAHIVGHTSHDVYHVFTTDKHLYESFRRMLAVETRRDPDAPPFVANAIARLRSETPAWWQALRLAALFHDVGKGLAGDHSLIGGGMIAEIARRLALSTEVTDAARWLVQEHLRMSRTSQRRDLSDPTVIERFVEAVPSTDALDALAALSWCDMVSVAPSASSTWKVELLRTLHEAATAHMTEVTATPTPIGERPAVRAALADGLLGESDVRWLANELTDARWATFDDGELALAATTLAATRAEPQGCVRINAVGRPGQALLVVAAPDRPGLLADLTAGLAAERVNILRARIVTTGSGRALDVFDLSWVDPGGLPLTDARRERLVGTLDDVLAGRVDGEALRERAEPESRIPPAPRPPIATRVEWSRGDEDLDRVVYEVKTRDRVGLLTDIARWLSNEGLAIDRALVTGEGDRAIDIFYVRAGAPATDADLQAIAGRVRDAIEGHADDVAG